MTAPGAVTPFFIFCLIGLAQATSPVFAGDALTPEPGVLRAYLVSSYFYTAGSFNLGKTVDCTPWISGSIDRDDGRPGEG